MSKFIKLTRKTTDSCDNTSKSTECINADHIMRIESHYRLGGSVVTDARGENRQYAETPEQILAQIGGGEPSVEINAPKVANPFNWVGATHPMTWPCVRCNKNHEVPSRGFMCPACVEAMDKEFDLELRHDDPRNVEALKKASTP